MANFDEKAVIGRIIELRNRHSGARGKSNFAAAIGISPSTYSYYERDRLAPIPVMLKICEVTGADINWLLTGRALRSSGQNLLSDKTMQKIANIVNLNPAAIAGIEAFVELLEEKNSAENSLAEQKADPGSNPEKGPAGNEDLIPVLGRTAAGVIGYWSDTDFNDTRQMETKIETLVEKFAPGPMLGSSSGGIFQDLRNSKLAQSLSGRAVSLVEKNGPDQQIVQFLDCGPLNRDFQNCFGLVIDGDSMSPRINDGDIVILSSAVDAIDGQAAVIRVQDAIGLSCKIIRKAGEKAHLIPINEKYETKVVPHNI